MDKEIFRKLADNGGSGISNIGTLVDDNIDRKLFVVSWRVYSICGEFNIIRQK